MAKGIVLRLGVVCLDHVILSEPDTEPHHQFSLSFIDLFEVDLPIVEGLKFRMLQVSAE